MPARASRLHVGRLKLVLQNLARASRFKVCDQKLVSALKAA